MAGVREKKIYCGDKYLEVDIYNYVNNHRKKGRSKKKRETLLSQKNLNDKNARRKFIQLLETNFSKGDLHVTCTYSDKYLPKKIEQAEKEIGNFIRRIKRLRKKENKEDLKYLVITAYKEITEDGEEKPVRIHHHLIINGGIDRNAIEELWSKGRGKKRDPIGYINADRLQPDGNSGFIAIATYLIKNPTSKRRWSSSQNLKRPVSRTNDNKYSRREINRIASNNDLSYWEKKYPGWYIADKISGYEAIYNELTGWSIYIKLRKRE